MEYLARLNKRDPDGIKKLCELRERSKFLRRDAEASRLPYYMFLQVLPLWGEASSEPVDIVDDEIRF